MNTKNSIKTLVVIGFLLMATIGLLFPSTSASIDTDGGDGFWTDDFHYESFENAIENLLLTNCSIGIPNGPIVLNKTIEPKTYDFTGTSDNAYSYSSIMFNSIYFLTNIHLTEYNKLDPYLDIPNIKKPNDGKYAEWSSAGWKRVVVHYFRFKLDVGADSLGELSIFWKGYAENDEEIKLYFLKHYTSNIGLWTKVNYTQSNGTIKTLVHNLTEDEIDLAVDDENYIDVCIVANVQSSLDVCTLYTDYIKVASGSEDVYISEPGYVETVNPIDPKNISSIDPEDPFYWGILTWDDYERNDATVRYQVYYENSTGHYNPVQETYLDGNDEGFTNSPISLTKLPIDTYKKIKLKATLITEDSSFSPKLFSWGVTWQTKANEWRDSFNSSLRTDVSSKIKYLDSGNVTILPVRGDWPMFGQNPQNTRYQEGNGPDSEQLHWYSILEEGQNIVNPVIRDGILYTTIVGSKDLFMCSDVSQSPSEGEYEITFDTPIKDVSDRALTSSFAATEYYLILATGEIDNSGVENSVICLDRNENYDLKWEFPLDGDKIDMCFYSSPIVYEDKVFITSWSGDPDPLQNNDNNKVFALSLSSGSKIWEYDLPAHSFSTPAIYNDMVFVGCKETLFSDNTFFVLGATGNGDGTTDVLWNMTIGSIGRASPVIYDDKVFVVSEEKGIGFSRTKVTALHAMNGSIIWEKYISRRISLKIDLSYPHVATTLADSTPAVHNDALFVSSPEGKIIALDTTNGTEIWSKKIYQKSLFSDELPDPVFPVLSNEVLVASPAYADGKIYVGTPKGDLYTLDASDGTEDVIFETLRARDDYAIVTSPIVSNGLVFFGDENGKIYSVGSYIAPDEQIDGSLISIPIKCPQHKYWKSFSADFKTVDDSSNIVFSILGENKKHIITINDGDSINLGEKALERTIRLRANLSADNISVNPELAYWSVTFNTDDRAPDFVEDSFTPNPGGWINIPKPNCTIDVWDNISGLNLGSAYFEIGYYENNTTLKTYEEPAKYIGVNGTNFTTLTADISALDFADNITKLDSITFEIKDYADNIGSITIDIKQDNTKPTSSVSSETDGGEFNDDYVVINVIASDPSGDDAASGIASVSLYYRYSDDTSWSSWTDFGDPATSAPFTWNFTDVRGGGYYELYSIATDEAENVEDAPDSGDVSFKLDNEPPDMPDLSGQHWFKELPEISIEFSDDFMLDSIEYKPEFGEWTLIESNIDQASYDSEWTLAQEFWDDMNSGTEYILEFRIKDTLDNTRIIEDDDGYKIYKDESRPNVDLEIPTLETEWSFEDTFKITAFATDGDGSGIKTVELFYRYSEDGDFDNVTWESYGVLYSEPYDWEFTAKEGNGYYEFYVRAEDVAGNAAESEVFSTGLNIFPIFSVIAMVILIIALILITIVIIVKWRKK